MSLHLIFSVQGFHACQSRLQADDSVVLLGDGVYAWSQAAQVPGITGYLLAADAKTRGISPDISAPLAHIDYLALVSLTVEHEPVVSWNE